MKTALECPPVSVVIPAWNAASTLARALASVAAQTVQPDEVIVVDDASIDGTADIAAGFAALPVRIIRHPANRGGAAALQSGLDAARNLWIAFLDADDEWLPDKLARQLALLETQPELVTICTGFTEIAQNGRERSHFGKLSFSHGPEEFWRNLLETSAILQSSALVRKDVVDAVGGLDTTLRTGYDQSLFVRLAAAGPVGHVPAALVRYHDSPGSLTKKPDLANVLRVLALNLDHIDNFRDRLSAADRRRLIARRRAEAAVDLVAARDWPEALRQTALAVAGGDRPVQNIWRLITNAPVVRTLKARLKGRHD